MSKFRVWDIEDGDAASIVDGYVIEAEDVEAAAEEFAENVASELLSSGLSTIDVFVRDEDGDVYDVTVDIEASISCDAYTNKQVLPVK